MIIREAKIEDIKQIQIVRNSVTENTLSNPDLVTDEDCKEFLFVRGKGWVCEIDKLIVGLSEKDLKSETLTSEIKMKLLSIPVLDVMINGKRSPLMIAISQTTASLYKCFSGEARKISYPEWG